MKTRDVTFGFAIGALLGMTAGYCWWHRAPSPATTTTVEATPPTPRFEGTGKVDLTDDVARDLGVAVAVVGAGSAVPTVRAPGVLQGDPAFEATVRAPLAGRVAAGARPFARIGDVVRAGDLLAELTPRFTAAELADIAQRRVAASADQQSAQAAVDAARIDLERQRALHAADNAASQRAVELAEVELVTQQARLSAARQLAAILAAGTAQPVRLLASIDGVVEAVQTAVGEDVEAGVTLFQLRDSRHLVARVGVSTATPIAADLAAVRVELLTNPTRQLSARFLGWTSGTAHDRTLLLGIVADDPMLRAGLPVVAHLPRAATPSAGVVLPETSIVRRGGGVFVYLRTLHRAGAATFTRLPVELDAPVEGGWIAHGQSPGGGLAIGAELVKDGAGTLLSIEHRHTADAEARGQ